MAQKVIGNIYTGNIVDNEQNKINQYQYRYFKDLETVNFKYGIELIDSNPYGGDEDPVILGFDIRINTITSPLFNDMNSFFDYIGTRIIEVSSRKQNYDDFVEHFSLFFDKTDTNLLRNFKSHYIKKVSGLDKLVETSEQQFTKFKEDKLTITMMEDTTLNGGYLSMLYKTLSYSRINGKQIIPENLLRFDMDIIVSEIRNYNKVLKSITKAEVDENGEETEASKNVMNVISDNVSRYVYHLYDCQFEFDKLSHDSTVSNVDKNVREDFDFSILYKFSTVEMEKWKLDTFKYLNNQNLNTNVTLDASPQDNTPPQAVPYIVIDIDAQSSLQSKTDGSSALSDIAKSSKIMKEQKIKIPGDLNGDGEISLKEKVGSALNAVKENSIRFAAQQLQLRRNQLINKAVNNIRSNLGLKRINAPINVYYDNYSLQGFIGNQLYNFANTSFEGLLGNVNKAINSKNKK